MSSEQKEFDIKLAHIQYLGIKDIDLLSSFSSSKLSNFVILTQKLIGQKTFSIQTIPAKGDKLQVTGHNVQDYVMLNFYRTSNSTIQWTQRFILTSLLVLIVWLIKLAYSYFTKAANTNINVKLHVIIIDIHYPSVQYIRLSSTHVWFESYTKIGYSFLALQLHLG